MSLPRELDEYSDEEIAKEAMRRRGCKVKHECFYCHKRLDSGHACKLHAHNTPVPADVAQEAVLQTLARIIEERLPNRRAFTLVVSRVGTEGIDEDPEALVSYVSNLDRAQSAQMLLKVGLDISNGLEPKTT